MCFANNWKVLDENIKALKENKDKKILIFNSLDNEKPFIDLSSIFSLKSTLEERAYYGDLAGVFSNLETKGDFFTKL